jgi:hypothetical protein
LQKAAGEDNSYQFEQNDAEQGDGPKDKERSLQLSISFKHHLSLIPAI